MFDYIYRVVKNKNEGRMVIELFIKNKLNFL